MRLLILLLAIVQSSGYNIFSQEKQSEKLVSVSFKDTPIEVILKEITAQTGTGFVYSPDLVDLKRKTSINVTNSKLTDCLEQLLSGTNIIYSYVGNQVILKQKTRVKKKIISGYIEDSSNGERLIYATITERTSNTFASSNQYGFYSINIPEGNCSLDFSYVGYKTLNYHINLENDTVVNLQLYPDTTSMKDVVVVENPEKRNILSSQTGANIVTMQSLISQPSLLGESDLIKNLQSLPGIQSIEEGNNSLYIRGGNPDQNLFMLDGTTVYNINHVFGYFSIFNSEAIQNTSLYKSGFPSRYGGRLSSVIDMKLKEGNSKKLQGKLSIGTLSASASLEGPINKQSSFYFSVRRTYLDLITKPIVNYLNSKSTDSTKIDFEANFYDIVGKINYELSDKHKIYISAYIGEDNFAIQDKSKALFTAVGVNWGNITSALRWNYKPSGKFFSNTMLTYSRFNLGIDQNQNGTDTLLRKLQVSSYLSSYIDDWGIKHDAEYYPSDKQSLQFGFGSTLHDFNPGVSSNSINIDNLENNFDIDNSTPYASESYIYAEDIVELFPKLRITPGIRLSCLFSNKKMYYTIEPRFSARYLISEKWAIKSSYARMGQYLHMMSIGKPSILYFDLWFPSDKYIKPKLSDQYAIGTTYTPRPNWEINIEAYYKMLKDILTEKYLSEGSLAIVDNNNFTLANGEAYGIELFIQKRSGRFSGWASYTLSESVRKQNELYYTVEYRQENSHKHFVNVNLQVKISRRIGISSLLSYGSGANVTFPTQIYQSGINNSSPVFLTKGYNKYLLSPYHRLDLGINFTTYKKRYEGVWNVSIYNVYNNYNANFIEIRQKAFIKHSYFSIIPSFSYTIKF